jgi:hypothetical protein
MKIRILKLIAILLALALLSSCNINKNNIEVQVELRKPNEMQIKNQSVQYVKVGGYEKELHIQVEIPRASNYKSITVDIPDLLNTNLREITSSSTETSANDIRLDLYTKERNYTLSLNKYSNINFKEALINSYIKIVLVDSNGVKHELSYSMAEKLK